MSTVEARALLVPSVEQRIAIETWCAERGIVVRAATEAWSGDRFDVIYVLPLSAVEQSMEGRVVAYEDRAFDLVANLKPGGKMVAIRHISETER